MTAQEWLKIYNADGAWPHDLTYQAHIIIRAQQERIDQLEKAVEEGNVSARILKGLQDNLDICFEGKSVDRITELQGELDRLTAELKEKEAECERWKKAVEGLTPSGSEFVNDPENCAAFIRKRTQYPRMIIELREKLQAAKSLAAARLADQEAIERHVTKRVATECAEIAEAMWSDHYWAWPAMQTYADKIRKKYGVE